MRRKYLSAPIRTLPALATTTVAARKALLVLTDLGLLVYWTLTAAGLVSVGSEELLVAWNYWSFLPLDLLAVGAGIAWSSLPAGHRWSTPMLAVALALTHAAGLMAISFFALWGSWDLSWWAVNLWLALMPLGIALGSHSPTPAATIDPGDR